MKPSVPRNSRVNFSPVSPIDLKDLAHLSLGDDTMPQKRPSEELILGQERAQLALRTALVTKGPCFNFFVTGLPRTGRHTLTMRLANSLYEQYRGSGLFSLSCDLVAQDDAGNPNDSQVKILELPCGEGVAFCQKHSLHAQLLCEGGYPQAVFCASPSREELFGRLRPLGSVHSQMPSKAVVPGLLHTMGNGLLILEAQEICSDPSLWTRLKNALRLGYSKLDSQDCPHTTAAIDGCRLPVRVQVALVGSLQLYRQLGEDPEFLRVFPLKAEFCDDIPRNAENEAHLRLVLAQIAHRNGLATLTQGAAAELCNYASWYAEHKERLTLRLGKLLPIMQEADTLVRLRQLEDAASILNQPEPLAIKSGDIRQALRHLRFRAQISEQKLLEATLEGGMYIAVQGSAVGQINALTVLDDVDVEFGRPCRVTASLICGKDGLVDIEVECENSGKIYNKANLIVQSFICSRFGLYEELPFTIYTCFEQNYDEIEGDSASLACACASLSALAQIPLRQGIAVTGSLDQLGRVQAVGGVNEKIEGFYRVCRALRLRQACAEPEDYLPGVIIPAVNVQNLMLNEEVRQAVQDGRFAVWGVETPEQALELLSGLPAGTLYRGRYPAQSFLGILERRLRRVRQSQAQTETQTSAPV